MQRIILLVAMLAIGLASAAQNKQLRLPHLPSVRVGPNGEGAEGEDWLTQSYDFRLGYVVGFITAYPRDTSRVCNSAQQIACKNRDDSGCERFYEKCMSSQPDVKEPAKKILALIDEFYTSFPQDRALPLEEVVRKVIDGWPISKIDDWTAKISAPAK